MLKNKFSVILFFSILLLASFLRLYHVSQNPPGLYVDEAAIGYNADTILHTGKDEWGIPFPLWFKSFGDYKMPLYIYATAGSMSFLGKTEFAVRFPSIVAGILTIILLFFFVRKLLSFNKDAEESLVYWLPYLSMFVLSIMPWHIQFSRGGFEVNLGLFFYMFGAFLFVHYYQSKKYSLLLFSIISLVFSIYTYHSFRIITPLTILLILSVGMIKKVIARNVLLSSFFFFSLLCIPILLFSFSSEGSARFSQTSAFVEYPTHSIVEKMSIYPLVFIKNYLSFFSLDFLFSFGDGNGRHQIHNFGVLGRWQLPFILLGIYYICRRKKSIISYVILALFLLAPTAAAFARPSPHSLRSLLLTIPFAIVTAYGLYGLYNIKGKFRYILCTLSILFILYDFLFYWHFYMNHYPKINALDWGAGNKEIVLKAQKYMKNYDKIVVEKDISNIGIYFKFYNNGQVPQLVDSSWVEEATLKDKKVLFIRQNYANPDKKNRVDVVYLPNVNNDVYAEFWDIK